MRVILLNHTMDAAHLCGQASAVCTASGNPARSLRAALASGHESVLEHVSFTFRVEGSAGDNQNESASNNEVHLFRIKNIAGEDSTYYTARYNSTPSDNSGYVFNVNYSEPLWKGAHLQTSYELRYNQNKSDRQTYDFSHEPQNIFSGIVPHYRDWDTWLSPVYGSLDGFLDRNLSRYSEYKNYTHNIRMMLRYYQEKYDYNLGFLIQPQHSNYIQDYRGIYVDTVRNVL